MVAIVFDYMQGYDPEWGALGFLVLWITNSLFVKGIVWSAGSILGFVFFTFLYAIIIKFLYGCFHNSEIASSAPPYRTNEE